jgi:hypothetical protein
VLVLVLVLVLLLFLLVLVPDYEVAFAAREKFALRAHFS